MKFSFFPQIVTLFLFSLTVTSCVGDKRKNNDPNNMDQVSVTDNRDHASIEANLRAGIDPTPEEKAAKLSQQRAHAKALIEKRAQEEKAHSMLTAFYFEWEFVFLGKKSAKTDGPDINKAEPGTWYKFNDDFTYQYGQYDEINGSGMYHFKFDNRQLIMRDDNERVMPEEFQVMVKEDVMVLVGKEYFDSNPKQIKTNKRFERPKKS